jgi:hypothetical protein
MDHESDLMWERLQARLDRRFGKYFGDAETWRERTALDEEPHPGVTTYKKNSVHEIESIRDY